MQIDDVMNKSYMTRPVVFETAESELFNCDFATRDDGIVFHFKPHRSSHLGQLQKAARSAFSDTLGHRAAELLRVELINDEDYGIPPNIFVFVSDFGDNVAAARSVIERGIRGTYEGLRMIIG